MDLVQVPQLDHLILASPCKLLPIRAESYRVDPVGITLQSLEAPTRLSIPEADSLVVAAADDDLAVPVEGDRAHLVAMASNHTKQRIGADIPDAYGPIRSSACQ
jgi:hypothetical protein